MILRVHFYADPILRKRCVPVKNVTDEIRQLVSDMTETMDAYNGIGLAANQVGKLHRIFVVRKEKILPDGKFALGEERVYINPTLSKPGDELETMMEGCISFPKLHVEVTRPLSIFVEAMDLDGNMFTEEVTGYNARVIMHENDHLNGTFHIDRCSREERKRLDPLIREIKKKYKHTY